MYEVYIMKTGKVVGKSHSRKLARTKADKLDMIHGSIIHNIRSAS